MKLRKFEKLLSIKSRKESKINFENKCDIFIKIIFPKLLEVSKECLSPNFNYNFNLKKKI